MIEPANDYFFDALTLWAMFFSMALVVAYIRRHSGED
jgi:hypothetical protein